MRLPLFILPVALLPGAVLPLHVFEPRYRRMIARALEGDRRFGVLYFPGGSDEFELEEGLIGCVAEIVEFRPLPDGRSLLLARGIERFRVIDGIENDEDYAEALVEEYVDAAFQPGDIVERRQQVIDRFIEHMATLPPDDAVDIAIPAAAEGDVSFRIAAYLDREAAFFQELLELPTERARLKRILEAGWG